MRLDPVSLASGAAIAALGALVLLDATGALDLSLGWMAVALTGAAGLDPPGLAGSTATGTGTARLSR